MFEPMHIGVHDDGSGIDIMHGAAIKETFNIATVGTKFDLKAVLKVYKVFIYLYYEAYELFHK